MLIIGTFLSGIPEGSGFLSTGCILWYDFCFQYSTILVYGTENLIPGHHANRCAYWWHSQIEAAPNSAIAGLFQNAIYLQHVTCLSFKYHSKCFESLVARVEPNTSVSTYKSVHSFVAFLYNRIQREANPFNLCWSKFRVTVWGQSSTIF